MPRAAGPTRSKGHLRLQFLKRPLSIKIFFAILNALRVPFFLREGLLHPDDLLGILWVTPIIPVGVYTGRWLINRINKQSFEYVMLDGINDSDADARELVRLIRGIPAKVNLIPFNPWPGAPYRCSPAERIRAFAAIVARAGYASPVRTPRGRDILAACGQLKSASRKQRASERLAATA